jgi:hypothetical protein
MELKRKMREGECRTTKRGAKYCMRHGRVRFVKKGR